MKRTNRADQEPLTELTERYRALALQLADIGFVARGSVISTTTTCSSKGCRCQTDPARRHGPYWQLSRSSGGTTRTRRLSEAEAELYQAWIANRRRAEALLDELETLSAQAADLVLARATDPTTGTSPRQTKPG
jgi:hypothetical protein